MAPVRPPKKSETIEVRLSHQAKAAFAERCRRDGRTASEAIRHFIDGEIEPRKKSRKSYGRLAVAAVTGAALGMGAAAPSFARATQTTQAAFDRLDRNHDGVISYQEFRAR